MAESNSNAAVQQLEHSYQFWIFQKKTGGVITNESYFEDLKPFAGFKTVSICLPFT
jgi:hypothetical protein